MKNLNRLLNLYKRGRKLSCITAYDASISKYLDSNNTDIVLVGDSLGQVIKGGKSTHTVSIDEIIYHSKCVKSGLKKATLMIDLPINTYNSKSQAYKNAYKLISKCSADLVKIEVNEKNINIADHLIKKNVPLCGHIGLLPQSIKSKSGFRKYGKSLKEGNQIYDLALSLDQIGVKLILLECVDNIVADKISKACKSPVIGIGSGKGLDGQVAVIYDLLGISFNKITSLTMKKSSSFDKVIQNFLKNNK